MCANNKSRRKITSVGIMLKRKMAAFRQQLRDSCAALTAGRAAFIKQRLHKSKIRITVLPYNKMLCAFTMQNLQNMI